MRVVKKVLLRFTITLIIALSPVIAHAQLIMLVCVDSNAGYPDYIQAATTIPTSIKTSLKSKSCTNVLAWSWGSSNSGSTHSENASVTGKANFQDMSITKYADLWSTQLFMANFTGRIGSSLDFYVFSHTVNTTHPINHISLNNFLVSSVSTGGSGGETIFTENVSINFSKITITEYDTAGKSKSVCWDIPSNISC